MSPREKAVKYDIEKVLRHYGAELPSLRASGWTKVRCYVHGDRTASATVNRQSNRWRCFVCDLYEDALDVIMREEGLAYTSALARASELCGAGDGPIPDQRRSGSREAGSSRPDGYESLF